MKKSLVFFDGTLMQGGAERVISILSNRLCKMGFSIQILLLYDREIVYDIDPAVTITIVEKSTGSKNLVKNLLWIRHFFKTHADVVVSFLAPFNMLALVACAGLKLKTIVADRNDPRHIPSKFVTRKLRDFLYRFADGVVLQTKYNQSYFSKSIQKKSVVIYNPVDLGSKRGLALHTPKQPRIVSVGRLMPQKNQQMLIEAFAEATKNAPEYQLVIYGEGPSRVELEEKIASLGLDGRVLLPGQTKDVFNAVASAELFVLSSDYEGMPNALIEAMCLGLPCISTKVSGATDLIQNGKNGILVNIGQTAELAAQIAELLNNPALRTAYAQEATLLNDMLDSQKIVAEWLSFFQTVCRKGEGNAD